MEEWRFEPAHDFGLSAEQRRLSLRREVGFESAISCFLWRSITRLYLAIAHRLKIRGRENLPKHPPFVLVANHASHLDAIILGGILPLRFVGAVFSIVPCYLNRTFAALPASGTVPRWKKICLTIGKPLAFSETTNDRAGWELIAGETENAVRALAN